MKFLNLFKALPSFRADSSQLILGHNKSLDIKAFLAMFYLPCRNTWVLYKKKKAKKDIKVAIFKRFSFLFFLVFFKVFGQILDK